MKFSWLFLEKSSKDFNRREFEMISCLCKTEKVEISLGTREILKLALNSVSVTAGQFNRH